MLMQSLPYTLMHAWTHIFLSHLLHPLPYQFLHTCLNRRSWQFRVGQCGTKAIFTHPEESLFLASEMNEQMPSVKLELASPQSFGEKPVPTWQKASVHSSHWPRTNSPLDVWKWPLFHTAPPWTVKTSCSGRCVRTGRGGGGANETGKCVFTHAWVCMAKTASALCVQRLYI